jgi:NDP-sugar pyrophosphorylase family protein
MLSVIKNDNKWDKSNCDFIDGFITAHSKKNITKDMKYIDYGLGIINPSVFHDYPVEQKFDLSEVYEQLACKKQLTGFEVRERFYEIGSIAGLQETEQYINQLKKS